MERWLAMDMLWGAIGAAQPPFLRLRAAPISDYLGKVVICVNKTTRYHLFTFTSIVMCSLDISP